MHYHRLIALVVLVNGALLAWHLARGDWHVGVVCCDVSGQVKCKVEALSAYRSQFPLEPDMFPEFLLREMFGREYFVASAAGRAAHLDEMPRGPVPEPVLSAPLPAR